MILAIDIGTTFLKVAVVDFNGDINFFQKGAVDIITDNDVYEINPDDWTKTVISLCRSIPKNFLEVISSVVISGNGPTIVPIDNKGVSVGNAYSWMDSRANSVTDEIKDKLGVYLPPNFFLSKIYWLKKAKNDLYSRSSSFLSCPEYLSYVMTGNKYTLLPAEGFKDFYWDNQKITKLDLDLEKFPCFISPYEEFGKYSGGLNIPGLKKGLPVICAGPDFTMSILGTGSIYEGILCDRTGTSEGLNYCTATSYNIDGLRTLPHLVKGLYTVSGLIPLSGEYVLSSQEYKLLDEYKAIINKMINEGLAIKEIRIIGGHAGIDNLNSKKADCFPIPVKIYPEGSDLIGNGVLGSFVSGYYTSIEQACLKMVKEKFCYNI